jgi:hypothetical protein
MKIEATISIIVWHDFQGVMSGGICTVEDCFV